MNLEMGAFRMGIAIAHAFEERNISYALGGALAYAATGIPRATIDVDVNVFVGPEKWNEVFSALRSLTATPLDENKLREEAISRGMFETWIDGIRIDVFTPSIAFSIEAEKTRIRRVIDGQTAYYLSAEALAVFKLLFFRTKDIADLERLIAVQGTRLDSSYIRKQICQLMGEDDERTRTWDRLVREFSP